MPEGLRSLVTRLAHAAAEAGLWWGVAISLGLALASLAALAAILLLACGPQYTEIPIETPMQPKLDVSPFQRVLVAGFVAGGTEDMDVNIETVRLLRSQLRTKSSLKIIDADVMAFFRGQGRGYQTKINAVLRSYMEQVANAKPRRTA